MIRSRPVSPAGHGNYDQKILSLNEERYHTNVYLYTGSISLEGVDDGHVYLEVWFKENWQKLTEIW